MSKFERGMWMFGSLVFLVGMFVSKDPILVTRLTVVWGVCIIMGELGRENEFKDR